MTRSATVRSTPALQLPARSGRARLPLRTIPFSLVDAPEILHCALAALSWLVRWQLLPTFSVLAPVIDRVINVLRRGEDRGGMFVAVRGRNRAGLPVEHVWHLVAAGRDGPLIPSMAASGRPFG